MRVVTVIGSWCELGGRWQAREIDAMERGGNRRFEEFMEKWGGQVEGVSLEDKYHSVAAEVCVHGSGAWGYIDVVLCLIRSSGNCSKKRAVECLPAVHVLRLSHCRRFASCGCETH